MFFAHFPLHIRNLEGYTRTDRRQKSAKARRLWCGRGYTSAKLEVTAPPSSPFSGFRQTGGFLSLKPYPSILSAGGFVIPETVDKRFPALPFSFVSSPQTCKGEKREGRGRQGTKGKEGWEG